MTITKAAVCAATLLVVGLAPIAANAGCDPKCKKGVACRYNGTKGTYYCEPDARSVVGEEAMSRRVLKEGSGAVMQGARDIGGASK